MVTRLFFHTATDSTEGLPTAEQSSSTAGYTADAESVNRVMDTDIGISQTSINASFDETIQFGYYTKFVSPPLDQADIDANTWTYNFAASQSVGTAQFPINRTAVNREVRVNCYVWRPSTTAKIGTIFDGQVSPENVSIPNDTDEKAFHHDFSGALVSSVAANDVIILEIWFETNVPTGGGTAQGFFYFDGTTENTTMEAIVSNHASFLETPEDLSFKAPGELFERSVNESLTIASATTTIQVGRSVAESLTIDDAVVKMARFFRSVVSESFTIDDAVTGARHLPRIVAESLTVADIDVARFYRAIKSLSESLTVNDNDSAIAGVRRVLRSISESLTVNDATITAVRAVPRTITESLTVNDVDVTRFISATRSVLESFTITAEDITVKAFQIFIRNVSESLTVTASVVRKVCRILPFLH